MGIAGIASGVSAGVTLSATTGRWYLTDRFTPVVLRRPDSTRCFSQNCKVRGAVFRGSARDLLAMGSAWMTTDSGKDCREILLPYLLGH